MVEFKVETIEEDDCRWSQLLVKTSDRDWHSADLTYGTEDELAIRSLVRNMKYCESVRKDYNDFLKSLNPQFGQFEVLNQNQIYELSLDGILISSEDLRDFEVGYEIYDGGSYWEPPSVDYAEYSKRKNILGAFGDAIGLYINNWYSQKRMSEIEE